MTLPLRVQPASIGFPNQQHLGPLPPLNLLEKLSAVGSCQFFLGTELVGSEVLALHVGKAQVPRLSQLGKEMQLGAPLRRPAYCRAGPAWAPKHNVNTQSQLGGFLSGVFLGGRCHCSITLTTISVILPNDMAGLPSHPNGRAAVQKAVKKQTIFCSLFPVPKGSVFGVPRIARTGKWDPWVKVQAGEWGCQRGEEMENMVAILEGLRPELKHFKDEVPPLGFSCWL